MMSCSQENIVNYTVLAFPSGLVRSHHCSVSSNINRSQSFVSLAGSIRNHKEKSGFVRQMHVKKC